MSCRTLPGNANASEHGKTPLSRPAGKTSCRQEIKTEGNRPDQAPANGNNENTGRRKNNQKSGRDGRGGTMQLPLPTQ